MTKSGFGPAYTLNSIGIVYNPKAIGFKIKDWADLWRPELANAISIPAITSTFGPAMVYIAADYAKVPVSGDNGAAAFKALEALKKNIVKTYEKSSDLANMFASGEIVAAVVGDFAIPIITKALPEAKYIVPASVPMRISTPSTWWLPPRTRISPTRRSTGASARNCRARPRCP